MWYHSHHAHAKRQCSADPVMRQTRRVLAAAAEPNSSPRTAKFLRRVSTYFGAEGGGGGGEDGGGGGEPVTAIVKEELEEAAAPVKPPPTSVREAATPPQSEPRRAAASAPPAAAPTAARAAPTSKRKKQTASTHAVDAPEKAGKERRAAAFAQPAAAPSAGDDTCDAGGAGHADGAGAAAPSGGELAEPVPYSQLAELDEGMMRKMRANRKRARDAQTLLKRAVKLREIKFFNRLINDFGNDKQLGFAEEAFRRIAGAGLAPTVYSFTNLLNACVRVGELGRARAVWDDMAGAGVEPNEVTYTVLVKGLAQDGRLAEAAGRVEAMAGEGVAPNVRTFSTLLRNCVRHADPAAADRCFAAMRAAGVPPDVASFEYLIKTRCAAMDAGGAWEALREMEREALSAPPQAYAALASASSLTGDVDGARRACAGARAAVEDTGAGTADDGGGRGSYEGGAGGGGQGGYGSDSDGDDTSGGRAAASAGGGGSAGGGQGGGKHHHSQQQQHQPPPPPQHGEASKSKQQFFQLRNSDALREVDEVEAFLARGDAFVAVVAAEVLRGPESEASPVLIVEGPGAGGGGGSGGAAPLDFAQVFGNSLPVRMEVCSGHGDWVTARALADVGRSNWVALEMRRNRVRMTWAKALRKRLTNVALLCGMAHQMVAAHVPAASLTELHVNYPDPPEWVGSSQCLVDQSFLAAAHRALRRPGSGGGRAGPGSEGRDGGGGGDGGDGGDAGHLTLVTDDPTYAMRICRELSRVPHLFAATEAGGRPFRAGVPEGYGGSYFDDMWKNGNLRDRYYIRYRAL